MNTIGVHLTVIVTMGMLFGLTLLLSRRWYQMDVITAAFTLGICILLNLPSTLKEMDVVASNAYNTVAVRALPDKEGRMFDLNRSASSAITKDPADNFEYWRYIDDIFLKPLKGQNREILIIGAGGFTLGMDDPTNHYTFVDIDPQLKTLAETHFHGKKLADNITFVPVSARAFVAQKAASYDLIILNAYTNVVAVPMETVTLEFLQEVKTRLKPGGIVVANVISSPDMRDAFTPRYTNTFMRVFPSTTRQVIGKFNPWKPEGEKATYTNVLYIYYDREMVWQGGIYTDDKNTYSLDR